MCGQHTPSVQTDNDPNDGAKDMFRPRARPQLLRDQEPSEELSVNIITCLKCDAKWAYFGLSERDDQALWSVLSARIVRCNEEPCSEEKAC